MSVEAERLAELLELVGRRLGAAFEGVVPPEARQHLLNAQRELLTALLLIYEHQMGSHRPPGGQSTPPARRRAGRARRVHQRIEIE
ncbi:MAG TPA: hypothetical protein VKY90_07625 [Candidatus Dormibacteraeota bacterium]|nr:hypothetical protein [Candidatus Dormibacteraeota bacterium]